MQDKMSKFQEWKRENNKMSERERNFDILFQEWNFIKDAKRDGNKEKLIWEFLIMENTISCSYSNFKRVCKIMQEQRI